MRTLEEWNKPFTCIVKIDGKIKEIVCPVEHLGNCRNIIESLPTVSELKNLGFGFYHTIDFPMCLDLEKLYVFRPISEVYFACVLRLADINNTNGDDDLITSG
jgi:hypothetical protein